MTDREALKKKMVKIFADKWDATDAWLADAAIDLFMEEAAKVANEYRHPAMALYPHSTGIAAALRAYIKEEGK